MDGTNLVNGTVGLSLRLFNVAIGGTQLYEDSNTVTVVDGLYSTFIGDHPTNDAFLVALTNPAVWVEVAVNGSTLSPRERLASVGYSLSTRGLLVTTNGSVILNPDMNAVVALSSAHASIGGGTGNTIGALSTSSLIGGGQGNTVAAESSYATIAGGLENDIGFNSDLSTVGGGGGNDVNSNSNYSTISGGLDNKIRHGSTYSTIGGGGNNIVYPNNLYATIAGGAANDIFNDSIGSTIGGGLQNDVASNSSYSVISGGNNNDVGANAPYATIAGGRENRVADFAANAFVAGRLARANHRGAFVWADDTNAVFASSAPNQFLIRASGNVGINVTNPVKTLHVNGNIQIGNAAVWTNASMNSLINFGDANFCYVGEFGGDDLMEFRAGLSNQPNKGFYFRIGNVGLGTVPTTNIIQTAGGAFCAMNGTAWVNSSDKNQKDGFQAVDTADILNRVAALPISTWHYKSEGADQRHIGPVAQDFHAAFGVGYGDTSISTVDADGVALAAIQALAKRNDELKKENEALRAEVEAIKRKIGM